MKDRNRKTLFRVRSQWVSKQALQCDRNLLADTGYRKEFSVKKKLKKRPFHYYTEYLLSTPYAMKQSSEL